MKNKKTKTNEIHPKDKERLRGVISVLQEVEDKGHINRTSIRLLTSAKSDLEEMRDAFVDKVLNYYKQGDIVEEPDEDATQ